MAISRRSGPSGEFQIKLTPAEARIELSSAKQTLASWSPGRHARSEFLRDRASPEERACIDERGTAHAEIVGNERYREAYLSRRGPIGVAAQRIVGLQVARAEAAAVEAADGLAALVEQVDEAHLVVAPARDVSAGHAADEGDLVRERVVEARLARHPHVLHVAAKSCEIAADLQVVPRVGVLG